MSAWSKESPKLPGLYWLSLLGSERDSPDIVFLDRDPTNPASFTLEWRWGKGPDGVTLLAAAESLYPKALWAPCSPFDLDDPS